MPIEEEAARAAVTTTASEGPDVAAAGGTPGDGRPGTDDATAGSTDPDAPEAEADPEAGADPEAQPDPEAEAQRSAAARLRLYAVAAAGALAILLVLVFAASRGDDVTSLSIDELGGGVNGGGPFGGTVGVDTALPSTELPAVPEEPPTTPTTRKPRRDPTGPPGPLTGAPVDYPGYERRGALVVKIDNDDLGARPQAGITLADIVFEEKVEGGITRLAAVFQGSDADPVGPVRSARTTDIQIVGSLNRPGFAYSGANAGFEDLIRQAPLVNVGAGSAGGAYFRGYDHPMPHNLYANSSQLFRSANAATPAPQWGFRSDRDPLPAKATKTGGAQVQFGGGATRVVWRWNATDKAFQREQNGRIHYDVDNWPVQAANVIVQFVHYVDTGYVDAVGAPVPEADLQGGGNGWVLTGGFAVPMTWERPSPEAPTLYFDANHNPINMLPGKTWIELVPVESGIQLQW